VVTRYQRTFHGRADQVSQVRADITWHLGDCPAVADAVLIDRELGTNAVVHSASAWEFFTVRCERYPGYVWVEVEDLGGPGTPDHPATALTGWTSWPRSPARTTGEPRPPATGTHRLGTAGPPARRRRGQVNPGHPPVTCRVCLARDPFPEQACVREGGEH
jgi:hypothetical protein